LPVTGSVVIIVQIVQSSTVVLRQLRLMLRLVLLLLWRPLWRSLPVLRHWRSLVELLLSMAIRLHPTSCGRTRRDVCWRFWSMIPCSRSGFDPLLLSFIATVAIRSRRILRHRSRSVWGGKALLRRGGTIGMHPLRWRALLTAPVGLVMSGVMPLHVLLAASPHVRTSVLWRTGMPASSALLWHSLPNHLRPKVHQ
jgi:hypothetical protein